MIINEEIAQELNISINTLGYAKNVLERDLGIITREIIKEKLQNGTKRNIGQLLGTVADWSSTKF